MSNLFKKKSFVYEKSSSEKIIVLRKIVVELSSCLKNIFDDNKLREPLTTANFQGHIP